MKINKFIYIKILICRPKNLLLFMPFIKQIKNKLEDGRKGFKLKKIELLKRKRNQFFAILLLENGFKTGFKSIIGILWNALSFPSSSYCFLNYQHILGLSVCLLVCLLVSKNLYNRARLGTSVLDIHNPRRLISILTVSTFNLRIFKKQYLSLSLYPY